MASSDRHYPWSQSAAATLRNASSEPFGILTTLGHLVAAPTQPASPHRGILGFMLPPDAVDEGNSRGLTRIDSHAADPSRRPASMDEVSPAEIMNLPPYERWLVTLPDVSPELVGQPDPHVGLAPTNPPRHLIAGTHAVDTLVGGAGEDRLDPPGWSQPIDHWKNTIDMMRPKREIPGSDWWSRKPEQAYPTNPFPIPRNPSTTIYVSERYPGDPQTDEDLRFRSQVLEQNREFEEKVLREKDGDIRKSALNRFFENLQNGASRFDAQAEALDEILFWKSQEETHLGAAARQMEEDRRDRESVLNSPINLPRRKK